jgi:hypothetical protein
MSNDFWKDYEPEPTRPAPVTTDRALDLALEALGLYQAAGFGNSTDFNKQHEAFYKAQTAITAIKQARALDKKAENARELGLDYEPAPVQEPFGYFKAEPFGWTDCAETDEGTVALYQHLPVQRKPLPEGAAHQILLDMAEHIEKWGDHESTEDQVSAECIRFIFERVTAAQPAPVQEPVAWPCVIAEADFEKNTITLEMQCSDYKVGAGQHWLHTTQPAAQRQRVVFPTMLRKMWSGGEVQAWLDETVNKENT